MKKILNNAGLVASQTELFQLTLAKRQVLIADIRTGFAQFMNTHFDLHFIYPYMIWIRHGIED